MDSIVFLHIMIAILCINNILISMKFKAIDEKLKEYEKQP